MCFEVLGFKASGLGLQSTVWFGIWSLGPIFKQGNVGKALPDDGPRNFQDKGLRRGMQAEYGDFKGKHGAVMTIRVRGYSMAKCLWNPEQ